MWTFHTYEDNYLNEVDSRYDDMRWKKRGIPEREDEQFETIILSRQGGEDLYRAKWEIWIWC